MPPTFTVVARIVLMTLYTFSASVETRATVIFLQIETLAFLSRLASAVVLTRQIINVEPTVLAIWSLSCHDPGCSDVSKALEGV